MVQRGPCGGQKSRLRNTAGVAKKKEAETQERTRDTTGMRGQKRSLSVRQRTRPRQSQGVYGDSRPRLALGTLCIHRTKLNPATSSQRVASYEQPAPSDPKMESIASHH